MTTTPAIEVTDLSVAYGETPALVDVAVSACALDGAPLTAVGRAPVAGQAQLAAAARRPSASSSAPRMPSATASSTTRPPRSTSVCARSGGFA